MPAWELDMMLLRVNSVQQKCNNCKRMGNVPKACRSKKREKTTRESPPQPGQTQQHKSSAPGYTH